MMTNEPQPSRRVFLSGTAGSAATLSALPYFARAVPASERLRVGLIGVGTRGYELHRDLRKITHVQLAGIADLSEHYLERIGPALADSKTPIHRDYRRILDDKSIDAVIIATPDHWHARMTLDALGAGKDVYAEKPLTYSLAEAVQVRDKARTTDRVTQVGYQRRSMTHVHKARTLVQSGVLGDITHVQLWSSRNRPTAPWRTYDDYRKPGVPPKSGKVHVDWERYQYDRPQRPYDARRYFNWQCYEEYSTGIFGILMSHYLDMMNLVMDLDIPATCNATGGIFQYDDGRTTPDTCSALFTYPSRRLSISFVGMSNNGFNTAEAQLRGSLGTLEFTTSSFRIFAEAKNALFEKYVQLEKAAEFKTLGTQPVQEVRAEGGSSTLAHLNDFVDNVKTRGRCRCPIEEGFKAMVGVAMAIESYKTQRSIRWDADQQQMKG